MWLNLQPNRLDQSCQHAFRRDAGTQKRRPLVHRTRTTARVSRRVDAKQRRAAARSRELLERSLSQRAPTRLGCFSAGSVLRLRNPRQPRELLVRLVRRPDWLHGFAHPVLRKDKTTLRRLVAKNLHSDTWARRHSDTFC